MTDYFVGEIRIFAGKFAPSDWSICDGRLIDVSQYPALFSLIGYSYGGEATKFALPDFKGKDGIIGRVPIGVGQGVGLTNRRVAESGGSSSVVLTEADIPSHRHDFMVSRALATATVPGGAVLADPEDPVNLYVKSNTVATSARQPLSRDAIGISGMGEAHQNIMPSMNINYIIALIGIYPSFK